MDEIFNWLLTWILPVSSITLGFVGVIVVGVLSGVCVFMAFNASKWWWPPAILLGLLTICNVVWLIYAANRPVEIDKTTDYEVKVVTFPDGKQVQMFHVDGENKNANEMFGGMVPEGYVVRRYQYKTVYAGVYYQPQGSPTIKDRYVLVDPTKSR